MDNLKYEVLTDKPFTKAAASVIKNLEEQKFSVWKLNFKEKLHKKGINYDNEFMILEVCDPNKARNILSEHPDVCYFLPCKVAVYEVKGSVVIGMARPEALITALGYDDLDHIAAEMEEAIKNAIDHAV